VTEQIRTEAPAIRTGFAPDLSGKHAIDDTRGHCFDGGRVASAYCGAFVIVPGIAQPFPPSRGQTSSTCGFCWWGVAYATRPDDVATPVPPLPATKDMPVLSRLTPDPLLHVLVANAILADGAYEPDHPRNLQLLGLTYEHRPTFFVPEGCGEGDCDHVPENLEWDSPEYRAWTCPFPEASLACTACTPVTGTWATSWEGSSLCNVPWPCSPLVALARQFNVASPVLPPKRATVIGSVRFTEELQAARGLLTGEATHG
jgi:hypothetical protein